MDPSLSESKELQRKVAGVGSEEIRFVDRGLVVIRPKEATVCEDSFRGHWVCDPRSFFRCD